MTKKYPLPKDLKPNDALILASECKCCQCGNRAVCFWPMVDPDIPHHPYCRKCVDEAKMRVIMQINK